MKKRFITMAVSFSLMMLSTIPVLAASNKITSVRLEVEDKMQVESAVGEDEELNIEAKSNDYAISGWEIMNARILWEPTDVPEVKVTLVTEDENYFSVPKNKVTVKGDGVQVVSVKKESSQEIVITLHLLPMSERVGKISYAEWEGKTAVWDAAVGAVSYDVYLFRDSRAVGAKRTTTETTFDFGVALNKEGEYYFKVRPVGKEGAKEGVFAESDSIYRSEEDLETELEAAKAAKAGTQADGTSSSEAAEGSPAAAADTAASTAGTEGSWIQDGTNWRFIKADGSQQSNDWLFINGKWYYFEADSKMKTGWLLWNEKWYYLGPDGDMWVNRTTPDGYVVDANGVWIQ